MLLGEAVARAHAMDRWPVLDVAGFVLALSSIGGAISLIPGGVGANEARVTGLLILCGVDGGAGGAISKGMIHQFPFDPESMRSPSVALISQ